MPAYLIADLDVRDPQRYREYVDRVPALIAKHGGRYLVRGGAVQVLEGSWVPARLIVIEFPSRDALFAFYDDPDYEPYKRLRQSVADGDVIAVVGYA